MPKRVVLACSPRASLPRLQDVQVKEVEKVVEKIVEVPVVKEVVKEIPVVKEVVKEVPVVKEVVKEVPVVKEVVIEKTVEKEVPEEYLVEMRKQHGESMKAAKLLHQQQTQLDLELKPQPDWEFFKIPTGK